MEQSVILFDGVCNLCSSFIRFIIQRDRANRFVFAPLQSDVGSRLLKNLEGGKDLETVVLIEYGRIFKQSTAALKILRHLSGGWPLLYGLIIVPPFIRNGIYDLVAKKRYKWFGRKDHCMIPSPELRKKFLDDDSK